MYCEKCGKELSNGARFCDDCEKALFKQKGMKYTTIILAALSIILPFLSWVKVPMAAGLYSFFGMSDIETKFSLFGYLFSGSTYQDDTMLMVITIVAIIAVIGIILNAVYLLKSLKNAPKHYKYGTIGAVIMMIMSLVFILIVGLSSFIVKVIEMTSIPYVTLAIAIVNKILIKKLKKQGI